MSRFFLKLLVFLLAGGAAVTVCAQPVVTVRGHVKFLPADRADMADRVKTFKVSVLRREGTQKKILAEAEVNATDRTYELRVPVEKAGVATVDCGGWQSVSVWIEDENLDIDFRGVDTARVIIKNPPYVYIKGGRNNELMNLINFEAYRNYQGMIATSKAAYDAKFADDDSKKALTSALYGHGAENVAAHMRYFIEHYADRNSVMAAVAQLDYEEDKDLVERTLAKLRSLSVASAVLADDYLRTQLERKQRQERMKLGNPAPEFEYTTDWGKVRRLSDLRGKVVVLDFWASWCGPCRAEVPNLKKIYADMKGRGVEFLSVSIDADKKAWEKALTEEAMPWLQGWQPDSGKQVMELYQFGGIPFILVLDKEGRLYRKNVRGEAVRAAVEDCLGGKPAAQPAKGGAVKAVGMMAM